MKDKCVACGDQFKKKYRGYCKFGTNLEVDGQTVAKLLQQYSVKVSCDNGFVCYYCLSQLKMMAKYEKKIRSRCKKKDPPKAQPKRVFKNRTVRDSYNILMSVNAQQEKSIKRLFKSNNWSCKCKVLPPIFSYLWELEMDKENPLDSVPRMHKVANESVVSKDDQSCNNTNSGIMGLKVSVFMKNHPCSSLDGQMINSKDTVSSKEKFVEEELIQGREEESDNETEDNEAYVPPDKEPDKMPYDKEPDKMPYDKEPDKMPHDKEPDKMPYDNESDNIQDGRENKLNDKDVFISDTKDHTCTSKISAQEERSSIAETQENDKGKEYTIDGLSAPDPVETDPVEKMDDNAGKHDSVQDTEDNKSKYEDSSVGKKLPNKCDECGKPLYSKKGRKTHAHCDCRVKCQFCDKCFVKSVYGNKLMEGHLKAHQGLRPYKCTECNKAYSTPYCLRKHRNQVHSPENFCHPCTICSKVFTKSGLKAHMLNMHSEREAVFQCDLCGACFKLKGNLSQHIRSVHAKQRNFSCDVCSSNFTTSHNLRLHRVRHESDQKVVCTICGKTIQGLGYKEHMKRHANERTYECEKCSKSFYNKRDLVNHNKIHTGDRPFKCHLCSYTCTIKGNLTKHMKRHRSGTTIPDHMYKGHFVVNADVEKMGRTSDMEQTIPESGSKDYNCELENGTDKLYSAENDFLLKVGLNIPSSFKANINNQVNLLSELSTLKHNRGNLEKLNEGKNQGVSGLESFRERNSAGDIGQIPLTTALNVCTDQELAETVGITQDNTPKGGVHLAVGNYDDHVEISSINDQNFDIQISGSSSVYEGHQGPDEGREESLYHTVAPYFN